MNPDVKIRRVFSSLGFEQRKPKIKLKFRYQKNSIKKILKDINTLKHEIFDNKSNNIFNYNFNNFIQKPKTASVKRYNNIYENYIPDNFENLIKENQKEENKEKDRILRWNYSYYPTHTRNIFKKNYSTKIKKQRIIKLFKTKDPDIIDDWQKPKMIKILEKNTLIEEAIITRPWKFFPYINNNFE